MLKNKSITELIGTVGSYDEDERKIVIDLNLLDPDGKIGTGEGAIFALIKHLQEVQVGEPLDTRAMDVSKFTPLLVPRGGVTTQGTAVHLRFYSSQPLPELDVDQL